MIRARFNDTVIAESNATVIVEGNHYFPPDSVVDEYLAASDTSSVCPWKGTASYFSVTVDGQTSTDAAWTYRQPKAAAAEIANHIAFWGDVTVTDEDS